MNKYFLSFILLLLFFLSGCDADSALGILFDPPKCKITNISRIASQNSFPLKFIITLENIGSGATAYNIGCEIRLKRGDFIVDNDVATFGYLKENESTTGEADFYNITNLY